MEKQPQDDNRCFCCGQDNEQGLKLTFHYPEPGSAETKLTIPAYFTGWQDVVHGGLLTMLLDETMAHACTSAGRLAVTVELTTWFHQKVRIGEQVRVEARITEQRARILFVEGRIYRGAEVVTSARAKFFTS